jgi:hypothetical protein
MIIKDSICQVYAGEKTLAKIYRFLNTFLPLHETLNCDYTFKPNDENYVFKSEDEILRFFINTPNIEQVFYWNCTVDNPYRIMAGAIITSDNKLILSLTIDATESIIQSYFQKLKTHCKSDIGVITQTNPLEYGTGADFIASYLSNKEKEEL